MWCPQGGTLSIDQVLQMKRVVILGNPGTGKSLLLRHISYRLARQLQAGQGVSLPIVLDLSHYAGQEWSDYVENPLKHAGIEANERSAHIHRVYLLDSLENALPQHREIVVRHLLHMSSDHPNDQIIVSCRANVWDEWVSVKDRLEGVGFNTLFLPYFNHDQILSCIARFCDRPEALARQLEDHSLWELAEIPQTLMLIIDEFNRSPNRILPRDANSLYDRIEDRWFQGSAEHYGLAVEAVAHAAQLLALGMELLQQNRVGQDDVAAIVRISANTWGCSLESLLKAVREHLLVRQSGGWTFVHATFQEHLAARKLSTASLERIKPFICEVGTGLVIPTLANTVGFLAARNRDVFEYVRKRQPELVLRYDQGQLSDTDRRELFERIFNKYAVERQVWLPTGLPRDLSRLHYPERPTFLCQHVHSANPITQGNAIEVIGEAGYAQLTDDLVGVAVDARQNAVVRRMSIHALTRLGDAASIGRIGVCRKDYN